MPPKKRKRLGEILTEWAVVSPAGVDEALEYAEAEGVRLGEAMKALGLADEEDVTKALAVQYDMEYVDIERNIVNATEISLLPEDRIKRHLVLPMGRDEAGRLKVAITDPLDLETLDMLRFMLNEEPVPVLVSKSKIQAYIDQNVGTSISVDQTVRDFGDEEDEDLLMAQGEELAEGDAPIVRLVGMLITEAVNMRASDIHIEPMVNRVRVRYRIDGVCIERDNIPKKMQGPVVNRFKILSGMDLAEKRVPLDGRIKMRI
ncbi:MAG: type II/IV secretion system protein, partial [Planctomycetota bacterium]